MDRFDGWHHWGGFFCLLAAVGIVASTPTAAAAEASGTHTVATIIALNLGLNLAASGLGRLCNLRWFRAGARHREQLVNHDILRLVREAWSHGVVATLR